MTKLQLVSSATPADSIVVGLAKGSDGPVVEAPLLPAPTRKRILAAATALGAKGEADEVIKIPVEGHGLTILTGLGAAAESYSPETLRRAAGAATRATSTVKTLVLALPMSAGGTTDGAALDGAALEAVALGALLGTYEYREMRSQSTKPTLTGLHLLVPDAADKAGKKVLSRVTTIGAAIARTRELVDTPPSHLPPAKLAAIAQSSAPSSVTVEVLDEKALKRGRYGGILGVGQGSANPPRLVRLAYRPAKAKTHLALVGKGITFDSGGLSIKPAAGMEAMKSDMAGSAAVLMATVAIAQLKLPINLTTYMAIAENMPSGTAQRPSDVITIYGGKTVEVLNTDAEGRLVMADALVRSGEDAPDYLVDVATLTGAQLVALGSRVAGIMGNDDEWRDEVHAAAQAAGELTWPMPIPEELRPSLDSHIADLANIGERMGGMMTAAAFLREFVPEGVKWAHVDIAGPSFNEGKPWGYTPKGGTGFAVRTLVELAERLAGK